jgi:hypothetical protein
LVKGVRMYGLRVAEPHHDATPHWHALIWAEDEAGAQAIEAKVRHYWLSEDGDERGAAENRVNIKRMVKGGAAGYVAKYIAKSVVHLALAEHQDMVDGQQIAMDFGATDARDVKESGAGHRRLDAWAAHWGMHATTRPLSTPAKTYSRPTGRPCRRTICCWPRPAARGTAMRAARALETRNTTRAGPQHGLSSVRWSSTAQARR